ncbi:mating pair formation protein [Burkholderia multivorans]|uniref:mating pair formation protein n=1 Tax=Burkholderia multivorans TaxID=87883 RepID=UPI001905EA5D|nr:mating pair formation protein [Burkholderia multivorans]MBJ9625019.1 mating pair formation protein [Burkholderia multivorans]
MLKTERFLNLQAWQKRKRFLSVAGLTLLAAGMFAMPEFAHAASFSTATQLAKDFVQWLFIDAGPYVFMAVLGLIVVGVTKGWVHMKAGVIAVIACFFFFCVPSAVNYLKQQAATQINNG